MRAFDAEGDKATNAALRRGVNYTAVYKSLTVNLWYTTMQGRKQLTQAR